jgi:uncharacterized protein (DUF1499 family)
MRRRRIAEEPTSRLAIWSRRLAVFAISVAILAILTLRAGLVEIGPGLATFAASLVLAAVSIFLAIGAFVVIWRVGVRGFGYALASFFIGLALLAYPAYLAVIGYNQPALADITTDTTDPPRFEAIARVRPREANPASYPGPKAAEQQRATYPDIEPLEVAATPLQAYTAALAVITKHKWNIVEARPPQAGRREGHIEAVARTPIMGFREDVVVRIRPLSNGVRVDMRSASRYGKRDFGTNAKRIRSLTEEIEEASTAPQQPGRIQPAARR